ncbi:hypothetical protein GOBAR_AA20071 [Gossypium barbadense]|uniref:RING-type domain-containing protein n=1 Tax=Gossypium barbadense TaxID=3634 RepID=A0A2P5XB78_GOSBA|nr:hypothetical protein GOBAR_AA20071 [Gossypium barbadense]
MAAENISFLHVSNVKSLPSSMFEIELKATFIIVESNGGVDAETFTEVGRIISHVIHEFPLEDLINDGNGAVLDMLNSMRVPVQTSRVEEIAASAVRMAAAARDGGSKATEKPVKVMVEGPGKDCAICLEEVAMGSEAVCMPCSHTFHDICIAAWLKKKKRCPYCHFKL